MSKRLLTLILGLLIGWGGVQLAGGADGQPTYKKGDTVKVKYVGEIVTGKVTSTKLPGVLEVEFDWQGKKTTKNFQLSLIITDDGAATTSPASGSTEKQKPKSTGKTPQTKPAKSRPDKKERSEDSDENASGHQLRTWSSSSGKFTIEARFSGLENGRVKLLQEDGKIVDVPLSKLSDADQEYVNGLDSGRPSSAEMPDENAPADTAPESPVGNSGGSTKKNMSVAKSGSQRPPKQNNQTKAKPSNGSSKQQSNSKKKGEPELTEEQLAALEKQELRTWTNSDGTETIEARFGGMVGNIVQLVQPDGKAIRMSLFDLSFDDRSVVMELQTQRSMDALNSRGAPRAEGQPLTVSTDQVVSNGDQWSHLTVQPSSTSEPVSFKLDPDVLETRPLEVLDRPYVFASTNPSQKSGQIPIGFFDEPHRVFIDSVRNEAIITIYGKDESLIPVIRIVRVSLSDGAISSRIFPSPVEVTDYSPELDLMVGYLSFHLYANLRTADQSASETTARNSSNGFDFSSQLPQNHNPHAGNHLFGFWRQGETEIERDGAWPFGMSDDATGREPEFLRFAGTKYAVIWNNASPVRVWEIEKNTGHIAYQSAFISAPPALSPNGKYLAINGEDSLIHLLDLASGTVVGKLPFQHLDAAAFDPQGRYIAAASKNRIVVYDLQEGKVHRDIYLSHSIATHGRLMDLTWLKGDFLLADHSSLISVDRGTVIWKYELPTWTTNVPLASYYDGQMWYVLQSDDRQQLGLFHTNFPHPAAIDLIGSLGPQGWVLQKGSKVRLELATTAPADVQNQIRQSLTNKLQANGMMLDDSSPLVLKASTSTGPAQQQTYNFNNGDSQTVTSTPHYATITLTADGEEVWKDESLIGGGAPGAIFLKPGESAQSYVNSNSQPNYQYFDDVVLPARLAKSPPGGAYGFSKLTKNGVEGTKPR